MAIAKGLTPQQVRDALLQRNADHEPEFYISLTETEASECASGYVSQSIKSRLRAMLDWRLEDERRAARPVQKVKS
jgi:hypothetical protein